MISGKMRTPRPSGDTTDFAPNPMRPDGLTFDRAAAIAHLVACDPLLAKLIKHAGNYDVRPDVDLDPFADLLRSITHQQLNGVAARRIHSRVLEVLGAANGVPTPEQALSADQENLRSAGLSRQKIASLQELAFLASAGALPALRELRTMSDQQVVDQLTKVRGIGPWTVHMLLMFQLGRPDVLPSGDFGVREGWRLMHGHEKQPSPAEMRKACEHWRPYRSVGAWYMWRFVDLRKEHVL